MYFVGYGAKIIAVHYLSALTFSQLEASRVLFMFLWKYASARIPCLHDARTRAVDVMASRWCLVGMGITIAGLVIQTYHSFTQDEHAENQVSIGFVCCLISVMCNTMENYVSDALQHV